MSDEKLNSALNLMRRMPPSSVENSLAGLIELAPQLTDDLLNHVDQPLKVEKDTKANKQFILCDYNRDGDEYRSPWSNQYFPASDDGFLPGQRLRDMEVEANEMFDVYRNLYFEGGVSSVYYFDVDEDEDSEAFGACFLIHKDVEASKELSEGWWDSIHVFEVTPEGKGSFTYKLTTTVMVSMKMKGEDVGTADLSGSMTQQSSKKQPMKPNERPHIQNMGKMLEAMELRLRNSIEGIYIQKTREVVNGMRSADAAKQKEWEKIAKDLNKAVGDLKD